MFFLGSTYNADCICIFPLYFIHIHIFLAIFICSGYKLFYCELDLVIKLNSCIKDSCFNRMRFSKLLFLRFGNFLKSKKKNNLLPVKLNK